MKVCKLCAYWRSTLPTSPSGHCCKYCPTLVINNHSVSTQWPKTLAEDWCAEFLEKDLDGSKDNTKAND